MSPAPRAPELLAPAGERAAAYAAFAFGADAIYTGLPRFSARAGAVNLSPRELEEIIAYAHALPRPRRVYVTLNTLLYNAELPDLLRSLALCAEVGADAIIVQDAGVARLARKHFPTLRRHASTQMALHNLAGVRAAVRLGFQRVTLARELTVAEIGAIARETDCEIETFLHGALCYSYSGLCQYSALLRGRSGNRGACAYPCRECFRPQAAAGRQPDTAGGLIFSMKDLAGEAAVHDLARAGVASLKIEGRKKSPLYVAAVVNYYRKLLDRTFQPGEQEQCARDIQTIFSRPWTSLYLSSRNQRDVIDADTTGHRGTLAGEVAAAGRDYLQFTTRLPLEVHDGLQVELSGETRPFGFAVEEIILPNGRRVFTVPAHSRVQVPLPPGAPRIPPGTTLFLASSQAVKRRYRFALPNPREWRRRYPVDIHVEFSADRLAATATLHADGGDLSTTLTREGPFAPAENPAAVTAAWQQAFAKLGDTPFQLHRLTQAGPVCFLPMAQLNALRRELAEQLTQAQRAAAEQSWQAAVQTLATTPPATPPRATGWLLKTDQPTAAVAALLAGGFPPPAELIVELGRETPAQIESALGQLPTGITVRFALPMITRGWEQAALDDQIRHFWTAGHRRWEAANPAALALLPATNELDLSADWPLYTLNTTAWAEWQAQGIRRGTVAPEDTPDNAALLARQYPWQLVWPVHRDPPLFISESCPHAAQLGHCPGPKACTITEQAYRSPAGETVLIVNRHCRFYTLHEQPQWVPVPPSLPVVPRADFLYREWTPDAIRDACATLARTLPT